VEAGGEAAFAVVAESALAFEPLPSWEVVTLIWKMNPRTSGETCGPPVGLTFGVLALPAEAWESLLEVAAGDAELLWSVANSSCRIRASANCPVTPDVENDMCSSSESLHRP
jgi:hypothetical protein